MRTAAPELLELHGVGVEIAGQFLVTAGDNPERIHSEAAFAKLCGVAPNQPAAAGPPADTDSAAAATEPPTARSTSSPSSACATTNPPATTSNDAPPRAEPNERSSAASSATSPARSTNNLPPAARITTHSTSLTKPLDKHRSIERFHRILLEEWAYIRPWPSDRQRHAAYDGFIHFYNHHRSHGSLDWSTPAATLNSFRDNLPSEHKLHYHLQRRDLAVNGVVDDEPLYVDTVEGFVVCCRTHDLCTAPRPGGAASASRRRSPRQRVVGPAQLRQVDHGDPLAAPRSVGASASSPTSPPDLDDQPWTEDVRILAVY